MNEWLLKIKQDHGEFLGDDFELVDEEAEYGGHRGVLLVTEDGREFRGKLTGYGEIAFGKVYDTLGSMQHKMMKDLYDNIAAGKLVVDEIGPQ